MAFTWFNDRSNNQPRVSTRIDYIWVSHNLEQDVVSANIHDMELITDSDHDTVSIMIDASYIIRNHNRSTHKRTGNPRIRYKYDEMTPQMWEDYSTQLELNIHNSNVADMLESKHIKQSDIDNIWVELQQCFDSTTNNHILKDKAIVHNSL